MSTEIDFWLTGNELSLEGNDFEEKPYWWRNLIGPNGSCTSFAFPPFPSWGRKLWTHVHAPQGSQLTLLQHRLTREKQDTIIIRSRFWVMSESWDMKNKHPQKVFCFHTVLMKLYRGVAHKGPCDLINSLRAERQKAMCSEPAWPVCMTLFHQA